MKLDYLDRPRAGRQFSVTVSEFTGKARIESYLDLQMVSHKVCADPPCHDVYMIPPSAGGATLSVVATDTSGARQELTLAVDKATSSGTALAQS